MDSCQILIEMRHEHHLMLKDWISSFKGDEHIVRFFSAKAREKEAEIADGIDYCNKIYRMDYEQEWKSWLIGREKERIEKSEKELRRYKYYLKICHGEKQRELNIELAKEFPIGQLLEGKAVYEHGKRSFFLCPFHNEKTASFCWFKEKNNYHCFGCQSHGDVIDLCMKLRGFTFGEAVKYLT